MKLLVGLPRVLLVVGVLVAATAPVFADIVPMDEAGMAAVSGGGMGAKSVWCDNIYMSQGVCDTCHAAPNNGLWMVQPKWTVLKAYIDETPTKVYWNYCVYSTTQVAVWNKITDPSCSGSPLAGNSDENGRDAYQYSGHI
jgi:hypothetical protein